MLLLYLAGQLLLLAHASFAATSDVTPSSTNSSESLLLRSKRSTFFPSPNCPELNYLTQEQVSEWPGITVDTTQRPYVDDVTGFNTFKCTYDTFFVFMATPTAFTRQNWWQVCGTNLRNGWRVTDASRRDTPYKQIPVGCIKPTFSLQIFDGSENVLYSYPTYEVVFSQPSIVGVNQKFQFTCPAGSAFGYAATATTITLDATAKITCESNGWWIRTKSDLTGWLLSSKVGCFKFVAARPTTGLPPQCQTGLTYYTETSPIEGPDGSYVVTAERAVAVNGLWTLVCPSGSELGYVITATALGIDPTVRITCQNSGWWMTTGEDASGYTLPDLKYGCFVMQNVVPPRRAPQIACPLPIVPSIPAALLPSGFVPNDVFEPASWSGNPNHFGCKLNNGTALAQFQPDGPIVAMKRPTFLCNADGIWTGGPGGNGAPLKPIYFSCIAFPAGYNLEAEVEYTFTGGSLFIVPILPSYNYCPGGRQSILADGTSFTSITTSNHLVSPITYTVKLTNGGTVQRTTSDYFKVKCAVKQSCSLPMVPSIPTALLPSGFVPNNDFTLAAWRPNEQAYGCRLNNGTALAQFIPNGPIVALKRPTYVCNGDGIWTEGPGGNGAPLKPIYFSCISFPAGFTLEGEVEYTYTGGSLYIVPLLPAYKYCPEGRQSILADGTPFTSITTSDRFRSPINYDVKLLDGSSVRTTTKAWFKVGCV